MERITGDQHDVFTLERVFNNLPAAPQRLVPIDELKFNPTQSIVVPYSFQETRVLATSSRNYVFYAVSPALQVFGAYFQYCSHPDSLPQFQFMMASSYGALRVYRVRAYCTQNCIQLSSQFTFNGFSNGTFDSSTFSPSCTRVFNATITALEYVNEQNIAVTVQETDSNMDPVTLVGANATYRTWWLNPQTMEARHLSMWPLDVTSTASSTTCQNAPAVPKLGSLVTEVGNAFVFMGYAAVGAVAYGPGVYSLWKHGGVCSLQSRGHSMLESCGANILELDNYFDSVEAATAILWGVLDYVATALHGVSGKLEPAEQLLRGMGIYGEMTVDVFEAGGLAALLKTPVASQLEGVYMVLRTQSFSSGAMKTIASGSAWARYTYRFMLMASVGVAKHVLTQVCSGSGVSLYIVKYTC